MLEVIITPRGLSGKTVVIETKTKSKKGKKKKKKNKDILDNYIFDTKKSGGKKKFKKGKKKKKKNKDILNSYIFEEKKKKKKSKKGKNKKKKHNYRDASFDIKCSKNATIRSHYNWRLLKNIMDTLNIKLNVDTNLDLILSDERIAQCVSKGINIAKLIKSNVIKERNCKDNKIHNEK